MHGIFFILLCTENFYITLIHLHSLLALTQQVKYLAECVKEIANNSKKESKEPESVIPGPSGTSGSQQEPIVISYINLTHLDAI
jgi:hypothetical protein